MKINLCTIGTILLVFMFLYSGIVKLATRGQKESKKLTSLGISKQMAPILIIMAGIFEVVASCVVIAYVTNLVKFPRKYFQITLWSLIAFTVLVTILFKFYPKFLPISITANLAVIGGFLAVLSCNKRR